MKTPLVRARPQSGIWITSDDAFGMRVRYARLIESRLFVFHDGDSRGRKGLIRVGQKQTHLPDL